MGGGWRWIASDAWRAIDLVGTLLSRGFRNPYFRAAKILMADSRTVRAKVQHNDVKRLYAFFLEHADIPPYGKVPFRKHNYVPPGGWGGAVPDSHLPLIKEMFDKNPSLFLHEAAKRLRRLTRIKYTWKQVLRALHKLKYSLKILKHRAAAQDKNERMRFYAATQDIDPACLVFVDESHLSRDDCRRRRGRSRRGRVAVSRNFLKGPGYNLSLLCACNVHGFIIDSCAALDHDAGKASGETVTNKLAMLNWFTHDLLPHLNAYPAPNSFVIMDNASVHHNSAIIEILHNAGVRVAFLPPYSPDLKWVRAPMHLSLPLTLAHTHDPQPN
jgi:transposase